MPYLALPTSRDAALRSSFLAAMREFEAETGYADAGGLSVADLETGDCIENYTVGLRDGTAVRPGVEPLRASEWWWCENKPGGAVYLGRASLRHHLTPGRGHLDFAIRPSRRREGHGGALLSVMLPVIHSQGIDLIYLVCDENNAGACQTIEACGGILERNDNGNRYYRLVTSQKS